MESTINRDSYNKIATAWAESRNKSFVSKLVIDFAEKLNPKGSVLDIGCGSSYPLTTYLCERNFHVTGIDASQRMIEIAKSRKLSNAEFIVCDFFDFISTEKFDGVLAWDSFFHFQKEKQEGIYFKVARLLKAGGYLLFTHGNADDEHIDQMMGESFYYSCLPKEKVCQTLVESGFEVEYTYEDFVEKDADRALVVLAKRK